MQASVTHSCANQNWEHFLLSTKHPLTSLPHCIQPLIWWYHVSTFHIPRLFSMNVLIFNAPTLSVCVQMKCIWPWLMRTFPRLCHSKKQVLICTCQINKMAPMFSCCCKHCYCDMLSAIFGLYIWLYAPLEFCISICFCTMNVKSFIFLYYIIIIIYPCHIIFCMMSL